MALGISQIVKDKVTENCIAKVYLYYRLDQHKNLIKLREEKEQVEIDLLKARMAREEQEFQEKRMREQEIHNKKIEVIF